MSLPTESADLRGRTRLRVWFGAGTLVMVVGFYAVYAAREQDPRPHETGETSQAVDTVRAAGERGRSARVEARRDPAVSDVRPDRSARFSVDSLPDAFGALGERVPSELPEREPSDSDDSERGSAIPIVLNTLFVESGDPGIELSGVDALGPRDLVAWRIKNGRHAIVARGWSDRSGEIHFPELVAPRDGLEIVVTAANTTPEVPGASAARRSSPLPPSAPDAVVLDAYGSEYAVRIVPSEATGNILLADADGRVFAQYAVPGTAIASGRVVDVTLGLPPDDTHVLVAHVLKDGRRSDWREIELGRPDGD